MQLFWLIGIFFAFVLLGFYIFLHFKSRKIFFENLISFCDHLSIEISFSKNITLQVIERYSKSYAKHFQSVLQGYRGLVEGKQDITHQAITDFMWNRLKPHEASVIVEFFCELGRHGAMEESEKLANKKVQFNEFLETAKTAQRRDASIYLKLCIILGIGAVVLLI